MEQFKMGGTDYTSKIKMGTYKVNSQPVYEEWTDGNYLTHRVVTRRRLSGSFTMLFDDPVEYYEFLYKVQDLTGIEGYTTASLYVNNLHTIQDANVYISLEPINLVPYFGAKSHDGFTISINER